MKRPNLESFIWIILHLVVLAIIVFYTGQFSLPPYFNYFSISIVVLGLIILIAAKLAMGKVTLNIRPEKFVSTGIYSKIRHPLYLGIKLIFLGLALTLTSLLGLVFVIVILLPYHVIRALREEREMNIEFPQRYFNYKKKTWF